MSNIVVYLTVRYTYLQNLKVWYVIQIQETDDGEMDRAHS